MDPKKREELLQRQIEREAKRKVEQEQLDDELLELRDRLETEIGPEGRAWQLVDLTELGEGFVAVKLGEEVLWRRFKDSKMREDDAVRFVTPCLVHPDPETWKALRTKRPQIVGRVATALASLYGHKVSDDAGKF